VHFSDNEKDTLQMRAPYLDAKKTFFKNYGLSERTGEGDEEVEALRTNIRGSNFVWTFF